MKLSIGLLLLSIFASAHASDIVTDHKDKVKAQFSYTFYGHVTAEKTDEGRFKVAQTRNKTFIETLEVSDVNLKENIELDLANSKIFGTKSVVQVNDSLFYNKVNDETSSEIMTSGIIRQTIKELATINATSKLKYKIKIGNVKINDDLNCKLKSLKKVCSATYSMETILNVIE